MGRLGLRPRPLTSPILMNDAKLPRWFHEVDVHTHVRDASAPGAIVSITPRDSAEGLVRYSCGIHPWDAPTVTDADWEALERLCEAETCVAVGECGLDTRHRTACAEGAAAQPHREQVLAVQTPVFRRQIELSERLGKPLIIHCVGCVDELLKLQRAMRPRQPWILHGFRGKPQQAQQLTRRGIRLSLGPVFNPGVPQAVDADMLLHESDAQPDIASGKRRNYREAGAGREGGDL